MSAVSSRVSLKMRTSIKRRSAGVDSHNQPSGAFADSSTNVACLAWVAGAVEKVQPGGSTAPAMHVNSQDRMVMFPLGTDVDESDRIGDITFNGDTYFEGDHEVLTVVRYADRLECSIRKIR